jgi:hypothetical protein
MLKRSATRPGDAGWAGMRQFATAAMSVLLAACASQHAAAPAIPAAIQAPANQTLQLRARAVGVQIYVCQASHDDPMRFDWVFKSPEAQLFDKSGKPIIKHFAGPTWQSVDGSSVIGEVVSKDNGPDPMAIPWLLLRAKANSGEGSLSHIQSVQRLNTVGGKAPEGGCGAGIVGSEVSVHYTADYLFYGTRS